MKKITLFLLVLFLALGASGGYGYYTYILDDEDEEIEDSTPISDEAPVAVIDPSNGKAHVNETVSFSALSSKGNELTYLWDFEGDNEEYTTSTVEKNYTEKGEYSIELLVTDSKGRTDTTSTIVTVVEDYHDEADGTVSNNDDTAEISIPVENGVVNLRIEYSLNAQASFPPSSMTSVTLRLTDSDDNLLQEEEGVEEGDGAWSYSSDDLLSKGSYTFSIIQESGTMEYDVTIDVTY